MGDRDPVSTAPPLSGPLAADPMYRRLKEQVLGLTGLRYYADKDEELARRIGRRLASLGLRECSSYLEVLSSPERGAAELDALIAEITIGETYFFRHRDHFDALRDQVAPDLIARNGASRRLRVWCAGCADGSEPYSLSILLKRDLGARLLEWEVSIVATDINRRSLAQAREGRFEEWSFRATPEELRRNCFSHNGRFWNIHPEYQEWVSFQYHNLVEHPFPSLVNNLCSFDLIICRNVMIYFGPELMEKMIRSFHECLVPGGWLLVGPSEPNIAFFQDFRTVNAPGVTLYQKPAGSAAEPRLSFFPALPLPAPPPAHPAVTSPPCPTLDEVRGDINRGEWERAEEQCRQLLDQDSLDASAHFYHALALEQLNRHGEAERALRRAIYSDRRHALAHYYLGIFLQARGDPRQAARSFENALELLGSRPDGEVFADADGITAAELGKLARMHLEILSGRL